MYFPYLRGRQYELLALRELVTNNLLGKNVIPIIEPVKLSSTLMSVIKAFVKAEHFIAVILNPEVGTYTSEVSYIQDKPYSEYVLDEYNDPYIVKSIIMGESANDFIDSTRINKSDLLVVNNKQDFLNLYEKEFNGISPKYSLIPDEGTFRRKVRNNKVLLDDKFNKRTRNSDYKKYVDEFFSDDHLYYKNDNFIGFSDYSIVGEEYNEVGFAPYAVAIHIVYFDSDKNLRIRHFVSESNEDITNTAGKFYEAVTKLNNWFNSEPHPVKATMGLKAFLHHCAKKTYPGLGTVKKLSLMHHLELMSDYLDNEV